MSLDTGSATTAQAFMDAIKPIIDGHAAWDFIEQVSGVTTSTKRVDVYRNNGSSLGVPFYVGICRQTDTTGAIGVSIAESYDSVAKTFSKFGVYGASSTTLVPVGADGSYTTAARHVADGNSITTSFGVGGIWCGSHVLSGSLILATGGTWELSLTAERMILSWQQTSSIHPCMYAGVYERLYSSALDLVPLFVGSCQPLQIYTGTTSSAMIGQTTTQMGAFTRELGVNGQSIFSPFTGFSDTTQIQPPPNATSTVNADPITGLPSASRIRISGGRARGIQRGLLKDVMAVWWGEQAETMGDTAWFNTAQTEAWTCMALPNAGSPYAASNTASVWVPQGV